METLTKRLIAIQYINKPQIKLQKKKKVLNSFFFLDPYFPYLFLFFQYINISF